MKRVGNDDFEKFSHFCSKCKNDNGAPLITIVYYTTKVARGPITKINQSDCSIAGPVPNDPAHDYCVAIACKRETINLFVSKRFLVVLLFVDQHLDILSQPIIFRPTIVQNPLFPQSFQSLSSSIYKNLLSHVINLSLTSVARDRTGRILALGLFCTYCQDLGPIFSQYSPGPWLIRCIYNI